MIVGKHKDVEKFILSDENVIVIGESPCYVYNKQVFPLDEHRLLGILPFRASLCDCKIALASMEARIRKRVSSILEAPLIEIDDDYNYKVVKGRCGKVYCIFDYSDFNFVDKLSPVQVREEIDRFINYLSFSFEEEGDISTFLSAIMSTFLYSDTYTIPLFLFTANSPGSGKTYLSQIIGTLLLGRLPSVYHIPSGDDEIRKAVTSVVLTGVPYLVLDNVYSLKTPVLDSLVTSRVYSDRVLGKSKFIRIETFLQIVITGNNVSVSSDTARRLVGIHLTNKKDKYNCDNLLSEIMKRRRPILRKLFSWFISFFRQGRDMIRSVDPQFPSFEIWYKVFTSFCNWVGLPSPIITQKRILERYESENMHLSSLLYSWPEGKAMSAVELLEYAGLSGTNRFGIFPNRDEPDGDSKENLRQALLTIFPKPTPSLVESRLNYWQGRIVEGRMLKPDRRGGVKRWKVVAIA